MSMAFSRAIGIDLGTSNSCVGVWQGDRVVVIPNDQGNRTTPSCASFSNDVRLIGEGAKGQVNRNPCNSILNTQRLIGRKFYDPEVQSDIKHYPFEVFNKGGKPYIRVEYHNVKKDFAPEEISAMILHKMKEIAEFHIGTTITNATIAAPDYFNASQCQAIRDAAKIAGLNALRILSNSTCAAITYGLDKNETGERKVLIFDLGGGTCDVSILVIEEDIFEVRAVAGDIHLGGEDFDNRLVGHFAEEFKNKNEKDLRVDPRAVRRLRTACERAKHALSSVTRTSIEIEALYEGIDFYTSITRASFEELCQDLFVRVLEPVAKVLRDSRIDKSHIDEIVLVGGSTHIPRIIKIVSDFFDGKKPNTSINRDEAVASGAAVQAAILSGDASARIQGLLLLPVAPFSLGIEAAGGIMTPLIKRNTIIPTKSSKIFSVTSDSAQCDADSPKIFSNNQSDFRVRVYEGDCAYTKDNNFLGEVKLSGILPHGVPEIEVAFDIDANEVLNVVVTEKTTMNWVRVVITNGHGRLSKDEIESMASKAEWLNMEEEAARSRARSKNALESYAYDLCTLIKNEEFVSMLNPIDAARLGFAVGKAISWLETSQEVSKEECDEKRLELERIVRTISHKLQAAAGALGGFLGAGVEGDHQLRRN